MKKNIVKLTESELKQIITESVKKVISELDWKTYMNAARKRKEQADNFRNDLNKMFPNSLVSSQRNGYDGMSDNLEKYAQKTFQKQHGKDGNSHQYDNELTSYMGGRPYNDTDYYFDKKASDEDGYWLGDDAKIRHYRYGNGFPGRYSGKLHDDTFDYAYNNKEGWSGSNFRRHAEKYDKDGKKYDADNSTVGNEISQSKNKEYNDALDNMGNDMENYYKGNYNYEKGKGWSLNK